MRLNTLLASLFILLQGITFAQKGGFNLTVKVNNYPDTAVLILGRYYGNSQFITDTAVYNPKKKTYTFSNPKPKQGGLYLLISADTRYTEFIIDKDQNFEMEVTYPNFSDDVKFKNSNENQLYQAFTEQGKENFILMDKTQKEIKEAKNDTALLNSLYAKMTSYYGKYESQKEDFIKQHPDHLMSVIFKAQKEVNVPPAPESLSDAAKREWQYQYYKSHYFEHFDLCDDRILLTPIYHQRLVKYFDEILPQHPDSLWTNIDRLIEQTRCNPEMFKYTIWFPVDKYQRSEIIGHDAVWVNLADKYYRKGVATWTSDAILENFSKRINRLKPLLIGSTPPEFYCPDTTTTEDVIGNMVSVFSSKKKYSIIIFWEMNCGHCKKALPKLQELYNTKGKELDLEVFAICKDRDIAGWKKYIRENNFTWINLNGKASNIDYDDVWDITSTPTIYVLDRKKRIVTKRIDPEHIEPFIKQWEELNYSTKK